MSKKSVYPSKIEQNMNFVYIKLYEMADPKFNKEESQYYRR